MIIDCHGHYTTEPKELHGFAQEQIAAIKDPSEAVAASLKISDDEIRESLEGAQLKLQRERGTDLAIFSPRAVRHGRITSATRRSARNGRRVCNDLIHRVCSLYPENFIGVCQLPQIAGRAARRTASRELERCVKELGFVGCNLNPDPSGGYWNEPPLTDS